MISLIVACDSRNAIGKNNEIPWHLSDDLKRFKSITMGNTVIMGKNTWLSLPFKPLKGRKNIVISSIMPETDGCIVLQLSKNDISYNEYVLNFCIPEHLQYINDCEMAFLSMVFAYYNISKVENDFNNIKWGE